jgi:copper oxidase (laccase) domain-containing protein
MTKLTVAISTVADGSMYNRRDMNDPHVIHNREVFLNEHEIKVNQTTHLHPTYDRIDYCEYKEVDESDKGRGMYDESAFIADAAITTEKNHALLLPIADCIGTVFYDPVRQVLMVSHLGRHSLEQQGGTKSVEFLIETYGSNSTDILVWLTPAAGKKAYPLWKLDNKGMKEAIFEQLGTAGILPKNITDNPADTTKDLNYYSYSEFRKGNREEDGDHAIVAMIR